jgi:3-phenylpropionate/cinnamic acid dioxygenase small subunit
MSTLEVTQLLYRLYALMDERDFDGLASVFTPDAEGRTPGGQARGRDTLIAQARRNHEQIPRLQHRVSNVLVDQVSEDEANVRAVIEAVFADDELTPAYRIGEVYRAHAVRVAGEWRLSSFAMEPIWHDGTRPVNGRLVA